MTRVYPQFVIAKFGGTSVADFDSMNRSAGIVLADDHVRLVVLSASAGVTNLLVELSKGLESHDRMDKIDTLRAIQHNIISRLKSPSIVARQIDQLLENIAHLAETASATPSTALSDELVSHGELMSSLLFTEVLREREARAEWFDARKVIRTNSLYGCAEPHLSLVETQVETHLRPRLEQTIVITQGFIGSDENEQTTTLGRGGSDYTASLLGEALHAARVDIWTDVAGIYTTDPRIVAQARRIDHISFSEASNMATFGAKVLHPATLLPAMRKNIPVFVGSSKNTAAGGTLVRRETENPPQYRAIAVRRKQTLLRLHSLHQRPAYAFFADIFTIMAEHQVDVDLVTTTERGIAMALNGTGCTSGDGDTLTTALLTALSAHCQVEIETGLALITVIGNQLPRSPGVCRDAFMESEEYCVRMIFHGASNDNLCFLLPENTADDAIVTLHRRLFE
ncbi:lysine-sensitive aspartokinase 3 [Scandinavium sp. H11S7]|uniref:Aspartokinase n=1 Tax=Scandinavium hiltneri TaxID=2926519 RepID=A0ABT2DXQ4_9ENTR|nr:MULTISPECIES: lysine-sensitive aspartokinase 3 [Scandinavium]MCS2148031.1 lysine-sensitive aspartokinase 3 [Scandinavium manionii]MCS2159030.1 lysine-sensitive aspartokinase 3 [Scandinavium hiltneri]MCS2160413.1 lysine-sensitive aspartokinase 3 [Scandinavium hiltneri]